MSRIPRLLFAACLVAFLGLTGAVHAAAPQISASALHQIDVIKAIDASRDASARKIDSRLYRAILFQRGDARLNELPDLRYVQPEASGRFALDILATDAASVAAVADEIRRLGGSVTDSQPRYRAIAAQVDQQAITELAAHPGVLRIRPAIPRFTNNDPTAPKAPTPSAVNVSEGDIAHRAVDARAAFAVDGTGVKICVLSDGVDSLATLQASGDLPPVVDVLPGQSGSGDEGSAMLEIVHDLAPGAELGFATAFGSEAGFAQNILDLRTSGCDILVDDIIYFDESPFQDGIVADAVNQVIADGALYFSSAGNEGNLNDGSSGTWEGDFLGNGTPPALAGGGVAHDFGDGGQSQLVTASAPVVVLHWNDVFGTSANDYDLYDMNGSLTTVFDASTNVQDGAGGDDFPFEISGQSFSGERLVVMQFAGADRMINLNNFRGQVGIQTPGCTRGHSAAEGAFSVAAVDVAVAGGAGGAFDGSEPVETFSCDGPRRIFFDAAGNWLPGAPAGDFSSTGGIVRQKPDIAAADGVATAAPGFNPFFGTSAAAPHAAAIAGLVMQAFPAFTPADIRTALEDSALDIEAPGVDRDSGAGIVMAYETLDDNGATPQAFLDDLAPVPTEIAGDGDAFIEPNEDWSLVLPLMNVGASAATAISATLSSSTPGVSVLHAASAYPDIAAAGSGDNSAPYLFHVGTSAVCGGVIDFSLTVTYSGGASPQTFLYSLRTGQPGTPVTASYTSPAVPIPDGLDLTGSNPGAPVDAPVAVTGAGNVYDLDVSIDGATCTNAVGATTVGIDHSFVNDLEISLVSPASTVLKIIDKTDGSGNNLCQTVLDDQSAGPSIQSVVTAQAPFSGSFTPNVPLSAFHGESADGNWALRVQDVFSQDTGNIRAWSVTVTPAVCDAPVQPAQLVASKSVTGGDLAAGGDVTYTVILTNAGSGVQADNPGDEFSDDLPAELTVGTPTATAGTISGSGVDPVTWNGVLLPGASVTLTIPATIATGTSGQAISNQATVHFDADRDGTNEASAPSDDPAVGGSADPTVFNVTQAVLAITPAIVDFGDQILTTTSAASAVTFENTGDAPASITALTDAAAPFARSGGTCSASLPITIAAGTNCTIEYTFAPTAMGPANQQFSLTSDAAGDAGFALQGNGIAGPPDTITVSGGDAQSTTIDTAFAVPLDVLVSDVHGTPVPNVAVDFTAPFSGESAVLSNGADSGPAITVLTDPTGHAMVTATANLTVGGYTVTATVSGVATPAAFLLTNTVGTASSIWVIGGDPQSATTGTAFSLPLTVQVRDIGDNLVPGAQVAFEAPANGASAVLSSNVVTTNGLGIASTLATANAITGSYVVVASIAAPPSAPQPRMPPPPPMFHLTNTAPDVALAISIDDGRDFAQYGHTLDYLVTIHNGGADAANDVEVGMVLPPQLDEDFTSWLCVDADSGNCTATGSGALADSGVSVLAGGNVSYLVSAPVRVDATGADFTVDVTTSSPDDTTGASADDTDTLVVLRDGFEFYGDGSGDLVLEPLAAPFTGVQSIELIWPQVGSSLIDNVLVATHAHGGFRIERLAFGDVQWLRLVAVDGYGAERVSAWVRVLAGAPVLVSLTGEPGAHVLRVDGGAQAAMLLLDAGPATAWQVRGVSGARLSGADPG